MRVEKVTYSEGSRHIQSGIVISAYDEVLHEMGKLFNVMYEGKNQVFKIISVNTDVRRSLEYTLIDYGYSSLSRKRGVDIRKLISIPIIEITDEEEIRQIVRSSSYC